MEMVLQIIRGRRGCRFLLCSIATSNGWRVARSHLEISCRSRLPLLPLCLVTRWWLQAAQVKRRMTQMEIPMVLTTLTSPLELHWTKLSKASEAMRIPAVAMGQTSICLQAGLELPRDRASV